MKDISLTTFAELRLQRKPDGSFLKTSKESLPLTTEKLLPESLRRWRSQVSHDGSGRLSERTDSELATGEKDGFALLPTPTVAQGRSLTSGMAKGTGRKPGSTGLLRTTLNDLVFLDRLLSDINQLSNDGKELSVEQLRSHLQTTGSITDFLSG